MSDSMSLVRRYLNSKGFSTTATGTTVMVQFWRSGTKKSNMLLTFKNGNATAVQETIRDI